MDIESLLKLFKERKVEFVVIGATAFPPHGYARASLDLDLFIRPTLRNAKKVWEALDAFGYDMTDIPVESLLERKLLIRQYALATDIHPFAAGVTFPRVWRNRIKARFGNTETHFASLDDLIAMKRAAGRPKDKEDLKHLLLLKRRASQSATHESCAGG